MTARNKLTVSPPYAVEEAIKRLGVNLHTARLRRQLTVKEVAEKIGTGPKAVADAEKGKITTSMAVYTALLWVYGLDHQMIDIADPTKDEEGIALAIAREGQRTRKPTKGELDNDF